MRQYVHTASIPHPAQRSLLPCDGQCQNRKRGKNGNKLIHSIANCGTPLTGKNGNVARMAYSLNIPPTARLVVVPATIPAISPATIPEKNGNVT